MIVGKRISEGKEGRDDGVDETLDLGPYLPPENSCVLVLPYLSCFEHMVFETP